MPEHRVSQGECLASIAGRYGFSDWHTIYDHPQNAGFRQRRPDPNVICPGDTIFIPEREQREESAAAGRRHRYQVRQGTVLLRLVLVDEQRRCWANRRYELTVGGAVFSGTTQSGGEIEVQIPADAEEGILKIWLPPRRDESAAASSDTPPEIAFEWNLAIGHLDPPEEISGIQARLHNLGYRPGPIDGIDGPATRAAVKRFQTAERLAADGIAGPQTQARLKQAHGC